MCIMPDLFMSLTHPLLRWHGRDGDYLDFPREALI